MLRVLGRARPVAAGWRGWVSVITLLLLSGSLAGPSYAHVTNPKHGNQWNDHGRWGSGSITDQVVDLDPGESIKLSRLVGVHGLSLQVGDKLFDDFSFKFKDTDCLFQNNLKPSAISVTALANDIGYGISFTGPFTASGRITKDLTICFSITVTDPDYLISDVHLSNNGSVCGNGFSSIVEKVFTGRSCDNKVAQLEVLNPGDPNPVFQDLVVLTEPREQLYVQQDMVFGGGGLGSRNRAFIFTTDDVFSQMAQIPEPSTLALSAAGLVVLLIVKRRKSS